MAWQTTPHVHCRTTVPIGSFVKGWGNALPHECLPPRPHRRHMLNRPHVIRHVKQQASRQEGAAFRETRAFFPGLPSPRLHLLLIRGTAHAITVSRKSPLTLMPTIGTGSSLDPRRTHAALAWLLLPTRAPRAQVSSPTGAPTLPRQNPGSLPVPPLRGTDLHYLIACVCPQRVLHAGADVAVWTSRPEP